MLIKTQAIAELQENESKSFKAKITMVTIPSTKIFEASDVLTILCIFSEIVISHKITNNSKIIGIYPMIIFLILSLCLILSFKNSLKIKKTKSVLFMTNLVFTIYAINLLILVLIYFLLFSVIIFTNFAWKMTKKEKRY